MDFFKAFQKVAYDKNTKERIGLCMVAVVPIDWNTCKMYHRNKCTFSYCNKYHATLKDIKEHNADSLEKTIFDGSDSLEETIFDGSDIPKLKSPSYKDLQEMPRCPSGPDLRNEGKEWIWTEELEEIKKRETEYNASETKKKEQVPPPLLKDGSKKDFSVGSTALSASITSNKSGKKKVHLVKNPKVLEPQAPGLQASEPDVLETQALCPKVSETQATSPEVSETQEQELENSSINDSKDKQPVTRPETPTKMIIKEWKKFSPEYQGLTGDTEPITLAQYASIGKKHFDIYLKEDQEVRDEVSFALFVYLHGTA